MAHIVPFLPRQAARLNNNPTLGKLITRRALAAELGISTRTILRYEKKGLPVTRRGFVNLYDRDLVFPWLTGNTWLAPRQQAPQGVINNPPLPGPGDAA